MKKTLATLLVCILAPLPLAAQDKAEDLVAGMRKAPMTYAELMRIMVHSIGMMQEGVLTQNRELVEQGANFMFTHPAPSHSPWAIMAPQDQQGFKEALVTYDKVLDVNTHAILKGSRGDDWFAASTALAELQTSCLSCHLQWKDKAQKWPRSGR